MSSALLRITAFLLGFCLFAIPALAQEKTAGKQVDYADTERAEAMKVRDECVSTQRMKTFYDCECLAGKFLAKRHELGPGVSADHIRLFLRDECKNGPGIAEHEYSNCMKHDFRLPRNLDAKVFCACYAEEFTRQYMEFKGKLSGRSNALFAAKANDLCKHRQRGGSAKRGGE